MIFNVPMSDDEMSEYYNLLEKNNLKYNKNILSKNLDKKVCSFVYFENKWYILDFDKIENVLSYE